MAIVDDYNSPKADIGRWAPIPLLFDVSKNTLTAGTEDVTLMTLPANTIILGATVRCIVAEAGGTSEVASLRVGTNTLLTGTADNMGAVGTDAAVPAAAQVGPLAADAVLSIRFVTVGTSTTAGRARVEMTCIRNVRP